MLNNNTVSKFKIATFVAKKRLNGYHLLKNPKGTPATEVNMLKHTSLIANETHLTPMDMYQRIHVDLANKKNNSEKLLLSKRIFQGTEKTTKKREISYTVIGPKSGNYKKSNITTADLKHRKRFKLNSDEYEKVFEERFLSKQNTTVPKWLVKLITFGTKEPKRPSLKKNFFSTLWNNLTNK